MTSPSPVEPPPPGRPWTVLHLLRWSTAHLEGRGIERARLDTELLLGHALGLSRLQLYLHFDRPLDPAELDVFRPLLRRRARREPLQYVVGSAAFRELDLAVDPRVLIPRPETEGLVEEVLRWAAARSEPPDVLEIGTGSGAIALSLRREGTFGRVVATDVSAEALAVARANAERTGVEEVEWRLGDALTPLGEDERFDVLVSNPPYVALADREALQPEVVDHEPAGALFSGPDGLDLLRILVREGAARVRPGGLLALEIGAAQGPAVLALARESGAWTAERVGSDLSGRDRYLLAARGGSRPSGEEREEPGGRERACPHC